MNEAMNEAISLILLRSALNFKNKIKIGPAFGKTPLS